MKKTIKNLEAAFAGESMAHMRYKYFADLCRKNGRPDIAEVFEKTAKDEIAHAQGHLRFLFPEHLYTPDDLLKLAIEGETYEFEVMYPSFVKDASSESEIWELNHQIEESKEHAAWFQSKLSKIENMFKGLSKVEEAHANKYKKML